MNPRMPVTRVPSFGVKQKEVADLTDRLLGKTPSVQPKPPAQPLPPPKKVF